MFSRSSSRAAKSHQSHADENGLFGQGEEAERIAPGVKAAQADGINAVSPLPADTLFFLDGRGDYDLVVAMHHDQDAALRRFWE